MLMSTPIHMIITTGIEPGVTQMNKTADLRSGSAVFVPVGDDQA